MQKRGLILHSLCAFGVFHKGLTALIETQQTVWAAVGEEAHLKCQLVQHKDVLQVTWQKISADEERNLATYNKYFGQKVNPDFRDKVEFKDAGLMNCSIVIRRVTEDDEGCYHCLFNTYPEGALTGSTCLKLYELHQPVLHVRASNSAEEAVVSCSATGRPAPTVTLTAPHCNSTSVTNSNGTVTVTATAVLPRLHDNSTQVGCAVRVLSDRQIEVSAMIPEVKQSSADGFDEDSGLNNSDHSRTWIVLPCVVLSMAVTCGCVAAVIFLRKQKQSEISVSQSMTADECLFCSNCCYILQSVTQPNNMPETTINDTDKTQEPLFTQNNQIRQRTSPVKIQTSDNPNLSPSASRRL